MYVEAVLLTCAGVVQARGKLLLQQKHQVCSCIAGPLGMVLFGLEAVCVFWQVRCMNPSRMLLLDHWMLGMVVHCYASRAAPRLR